MGTGIRDAHGDAARASMSAMEMEHQHESLHPVSGLDVVHVARPGHQGGLIAAVINELTE